MGLLIIAAIIGNQLGWWLGKNFGQRLENKPDGWLFKKKYIEEADAHFRDNGSLSLVIARLSPSCAPSFPLSLAWLTCRV